MFSIRDHELQELSTNDIDAVAGAGEGLTFTVNGQSVHFGTDDKGAFVSIKYPDGSAQVIRT